MSDTHYCHLLREHDPLSHWSQRWDFVGSHSSMSQVSTSFDISWLRQRIPQDLEVSLVRSQHLLPLLYSLYYSLVNTTCLAPHEKMGKKNVLVEEVLKSGLSNPGNIFTRRATQLRFTRVHYFPPKLTCELSVIATLLTGAYSVLVRNRRWLSRAYSGRAS